MSNTNLSIIILAAGKGTRMHSPKAKVLHKISGFEMLYYSISASLELSDDITVVVGHQKDAVIESMSRYFESINYHTQDTLTYPGTGGAVMGVQLKYDRVLVLNADMPLVTAKSLKPFLDSSADLQLSIFELENPDGYGRVVIEDSRVKSIVEQKDASPDQLSITSVNAGIYCFKSSLLREYLPKLSSDNAQKEYYLTDIVALAVSDSKIVDPITIDEEHFKGVNSKLDLHNADTIMQQRIKERWMSSGVRMELAQSIYIESSVEFEGECIVENGVRVTGCSIIKNSHIKAHSVVEDSTLIDSSCGPLAHLRPLSTLINSHVGNFVETKKATLKGVKAGHLSYLGDVDIDEGSNIGAGTITCNYDGKAKYKTIIGKNVFVGSDTQIIAPCVIEDDVIIAAGTTLNSDRVESGSLAISRTPLKIIKGFYRKFFKDLS